MSIFELYAKMFELSITFLFELQFFYLTFQIEMCMIEEEGVIIMTVGEQIKILCVRCGISVSELSRRLGKTNQAFGQKIKRGTFTVDEMKEVASAVGCNYEGAFILPDGDKIEY